MKTNLLNGNLVLLGFDGMDHDLTKTFISEGHMPNLSRLLERGSSAPLKSVFPPDSIPAWITAFTGKDPSEHGIIDHVNYLIKGEDSLKIDTSIFHGKTFWDEVSKTGQEVCVVNPFMAYPVWNVCGSMVSGPVFIEGEIQASDPSYYGDTTIPSSIGGIVDLPTKKNMNIFFDNTISDTEEQACFGLNILNSKKPKLFFQTFLTTDRIQHHLWRYTDVSDPTYPGETDLQNSIILFFSKIDDIIGRFMETLNEQDVLVIMSDHGHGMRCTHTLNLNDFFRIKGLLYHNKKDAPGLQKIILEKSKNFVLSFMRKNNLEDYMHIVAKFVPNAKALKKGEHLNKSSNTKVKASSFAGVNPFGGVEINNVVSIDYETLRTEVIDTMNGLTFNGKKIFLWIKRREEVYSGSQISKYPDILYEMIPELGTGMSMFSGLYSENPTHKKISGGHKQYGVFIINRDDFIVDASNCSIENFYSSILSVLGVDAKDHHSTSFLNKVS